MGSPSKKSIVDREFLEMRSHILELAAALDRAERAGVPADATRWQQLQAATKLLLSEDAKRAENVQLLFSRPFEADWRTKLSV